MTMKKRVFEISVLSIIVVILVYGQAALFPEKSKRPEEKEPDSEKVINPLSYDKIKNNTYSGLIGTSREKLYEKLGKPKESSQENEMYRLLDYGSNDNQFLQVRLKNNKVEEILSLGLKDKNAPFKIGMHETELSSLAALTASFNLDEDFSFELAEEDINYRPIVAFENDTFGIFYFDPVANDLIGISYLSKDRLKEKLPYPITKGQRKKVAFSKDEMDHQKETQLFSENYRKVINHLRQRQHLVTLGNFYDNDEAAKKALSTFLQQENKLLSTEGQEKLKEANELGSKYVITGKEWNNVTKGLSLPKITSGILKVNVVDSFAEAFEDFMFPPLNRPFHKETNDIFSVATYNENMIVLLSDIKVTKDSSKEVDKSDIQ